MGSRVNLMPDEDFNLARSSHPAWGGHGIAYQDLDRFYGANVTMPETRRRKQLLGIFRARQDELRKAAQAMDELMERLAD